MAKKPTNQPTNQPATEESKWVFLPVHKTRLIKMLAKAVLLQVDFDRSTILPLVFKRGKEDKDFMYFSLPSDFNANIRKSIQNPKTRRFEHEDYTISVNELKNSGLDKPLKDVETEEEQEFVGENTDDVEEFPF